MDNELIDLSRKACLGDAKAFELFCVRWKQAFRFQRNLTGWLKADIFEFAQVEEAGWDKVCESHARCWPRVGPVIARQLDGIEFGSVEACVVCNLARCPTCGGDMVKTPAIFTDAERRLYHFDVKCRRCGECR
jgi:hypothetical protein